MGPPLGDRIAAVLNPCVTRLGFAAAQGGGADSGQVLFCAAEDDLGERFPGLPRVWDLHPGKGWCVDLMVDHDAASVVNARLEGSDLIDVMRMAGHNSLAAGLERLDALDPDEAVERIKAAIEALFTAAAARAE